MDQAKARELPGRRRYDVDVKRVPSTGQPPTHHEKKGDLQMKNVIIALCISATLALGLVNLTAAQTPAQPPAKKPGEAAREAREARPERIAQMKAECLAKATTDQAKAQCEQSAQAALDRMKQRFAREKAACLKRATTDQGRAACESRFAGPTTAAPASPAPASSTSPAAPAPTGGAAPPPAKQ